MDKVIGILAIIVVGTAIIAGCLIVEWLMDDKRTNKGQLGIDNTDYLRFPDGCRNRCSGDGHDNKDKIMVLNALRMFATPYEKDIVDEIAEDLHRLEDQKLLTESLAKECERLHEVNYGNNERTVKPDEN